MVAGLFGNLAEMAVESFFVKSGFSDETGAKKAGGIFLSKSDLKTPMGLVVGYMRLVNTKAKQKKKVKFKIDSA